MGKGMFDGPLLGKETPEIDMSCDPTIHELVRCIDLQAQRLIDLETTVSDLMRQARLQCPPTGYNEAKERIETRAREQRMFSRTGLIPDEIIDRIVGEAKKCQTRNAEKSKPSSGDRS